MVAFPSCRQMHVACCGLLSGLAQQMLEEQAALEACGSSVQPILARISECLDGNCSTQSATEDGSPPTVSAQAAARAALLALLQQLTVKAPQAMHPFLVDAGPLPPGELLWEHAGGDSDHYAVSALLTTFAGVLKPCLSGAGGDLQDIANFLQQLQANSTVSAQLLQFAARHEKLLPPIVLYGLSRVFRHADVSTRLNYCAKAKLVFPLCQFRAPSLPASLRQRSLTRLADRLRLQPVALFDNAPGTPAAEDGAVLQPVKVGVVDAVWRLVRLSSELQDGALAAFSGECLIMSGDLCIRLAVQWNIVSGASTKHLWRARCMPQPSDGWPTSVRQASYWRCLGRCTHRQSPLIRMHWHAL